MDKEKWAELKEWLPEYIRSGGATNQSLGEQRKTLGVMLHSLDEEERWAIEYAALGYKGPMYRRPSGEDVTDVLVEITKGNYESCELILGQLIVNYPRC